MQWWEILSLLGMLQASKDDAEQPLIADRLESFSPSRGAADVCIVGCGPAGLSLAAELATRGISVALVGESLVYRQIFLSIVSKDTGCGRFTGRCRWNLCFPLKPKGNEEKEFLVWPIASRTVPCKNINESILHIIRHVIHSYSHTRMVLPFNA